MINYKDHLILSERTIKEALVQLTRLGIDIILFVVDEENRLIGSITDGDIRRGLINGASIEQPVNTIIQKNPRFIRKGDRDIKKIIEFREQNFRIIPVLDESDRVVKVINFRQLQSYLPIDAVIMAGGKGQRLLPLTKDVPKPLLRVGDKPIIEHNIDRLTFFGIDDFWISINYLGEKIVNHFGNGDERNIRINYVNEDRPLGTIGAISKIENFSHDYVLITNSDLLTSIDYEHFFLEFLDQDADMAIVTIPYQVNIPYAVLETSNGHVISLKEKPTYTYYSNGGIYLVKKEILKLVPFDNHFNATDLIEQLIKINKKVFSYPLIGYWLDIGSHEDYAKAQIDIKNLIFSNSNRGF